MAPLLFLVVPIIMFIIMAAKDEYRQYRKCNPTSEDGGYRITFDKFLELLETDDGWDYIDLCSDHAEYDRPHVSMNQPRVNFTFSFTYSDWRKYCAWYESRRQADMQKARIDFESRGADELARIQKKD